MDQLQQQYHVEDVGRILLQTQEQLRQLREQLTAQNNVTSNGKVSNDVQPTLEEILLRAEGELRSKAEVVLHTMITQPSMDTQHTMNSPFSLPAVHNPSNTNNPSISPSKLRRKRSTVGSLGKAKDEEQPDVDYFRSRFKNPAVQIANTTTSQPSRIRSRGKVAKQKTLSHPRLLPFANKHDPSAPPPVLSPVDAKQGILSLLNRGFLPPNIDLTPAFQPSGNASPNGNVLKNATSKLYHRGDQPVRAMPYSNPSGFNLASLKFDMSPSLKQEPALRGDDVSQESNDSHRLNTVTINFPIDVNNKNQSTNQESDSTPTHGHEEEDGDDTTDQEHNKSDPNSMDDLRKNVDKIRGYNELMDAYSLHQFIIHKGRAMRETPEFQSLKRVGHEIWGSVEEVIKALETLLARYFVPLAYIDGQRLMAVASMELAVFSTRDLLSCVVNEDQVASLIRRPGQRYKGKDRKRRAAITVQSFFRMLLLRNRYWRTRRNGTSAMIIQKKWRAYQCRQTLRKMVIAKRDACVSEWQTKMKCFRKEWPEIKQKRRVIIHVPSISVDERSRLVAENFTVKQNLQLSRLAGIVDDLVEIIYVVPFELSTDVTQYYMKLLQLGGIPNAATRVKLVFPEHVSQFPAHFSLTSILLYSPHCLKRIDRLIKGKDAYLVMGVPGPEDQRLALRLQVPMLGLVDPQASLSLLTRSGGKRCFIKADVNVPIGTYDIYDFDELLFALAKLIVSHVEQNVWLLRLDFDPFHTGTAILDVSTLTILRDVRREKRAPEYWKQPGVRDALVRTLLGELEREIAGLARLAHPEVYPTWTDFTLAVAQFGVIIEAMPAQVLGVVRANIFIEPHGEIHVMSTQDVLVNGSTVSQRRRRPAAYAFPQTLVPYEAIRGASLAVGQLLYTEYTLTGYASVDFQLFREETMISGSYDFSSSTTSVERLWALTLYPYLTDSAATFATFHILNRGVLNPHTGNYHLMTTADSSRLQHLPLSGNGGEVRTGSEFVVQEAVLSGLSSLERGPQRGYVVLDYVFHPNVSTMQYSAFFHTCRLNGVCFDVERCIGTIFLLADSLAGGVFGVLCTGESATQALSYLRTALEVLGREVGTHILPSSVVDADSLNGNFAELLMMVRQTLKHEKKVEMDRRIDSPNGSHTPIVREGGEVDGTSIVRKSRNPRVDPLRRLRR